MLNLLANVKTTKNVWKSNAQSRLLLKNKFPTTEIPLRIRYQQKSPVKNDRTGPNHGVMDRWFKWQPHNRDWMRLVPIHLNESLIRHLETSSANQSEGPPKRETVNR